MIALPADTTDADSAHNPTARSLSGGADEGALEAAARLAEACSPISEAQAERLIGAICFKTGPPGTIGAELEWLVRDGIDPAQDVPFGRISKVFESLQKPGVLPGAGLLTLEPGGQVELSTAPAKDLGDCVAAASGDLAVYTRRSGTQASFSPVTVLIRSAVRAEYWRCRAMQRWRNTSIAAVIGAGS